MEVIKVQIILIIRDPTVGPEIANVGNICQAEILSKEAGELAKLVECLPHMQKALSSIPNTVKKKF